MDVTRWDDVPVEQLSETIGRQMIHTEGLTVARILLAEGAVVPEHSHPNEQVTNILSGALRFAMDGEERVAGAGETVVIPGGVPHRVDALAESVVLDVFRPIREDWVRGDDAYLRGDSD